MQDRPAIKTAIPKRRWQLGDFSATLLGEVDSSDHRTYRWVLALVAMGDAEPTLYVTCEAAPPSAAADGRWQLRLLSEGLADVLDTADRWSDMVTFADQALDLAQQVLGLQNQQPLRLL